MNVRELITILESLAKEHGDEKDVELVTENGMGLRPFYCPERKRIWLNDYDMEDPYPDN